MKDIYSLKEISKYLDLSESFVRNLVRAKSIPYFRLGNRLKFDINEINKWINDLSKKEKRNNILFDV